MTNVLTISGNLTGDVEVREFGDNTKARVGIAWNQNVKTDDGGWDTKPHFFNVEAWGGQAKTLAKFAKGDLVTIFGRLDWHSWETDDGKREAVTILANAVVGDAMYEKEPAEGTKFTKNDSKGSGGSRGRRRTKDDDDDEEPQERPSGRSSSRGRSSGSGSRSGSRGRASASSQSSDGEPDLPDDDIPW